MRRSFLNIMNPSVSAATPLYLLMYDLKLVKFAGTCGLYEIHGYYLGIYLSDINSPLAPLECAVLPSNSFNASPLGHVV